MRYFAHTVKTGPLNSKLIFLLSYDIIKLFSERSEAIIMKRKTLLCLLLLSATVLTNIAPAAAAKKAALPAKRLTLYEGQKKAISIKNKNKKAAYTFTSSSPKKAAVSKKGVITAKKQGKAKIVVKEKVKSGRKKTVRKIGVITVTIQKKKFPQQTPPSQASAAPTAAASTPPAAIAPSASQNPVQASPSGSPQDLPQTTQQPTETPIPTPDLYTKTVLTLSVTDKDLYSVDGNTCRVDMQYFDGEASGDYFTGNTSEEGTVVTKDYKDGDTQLCARYMLKGTDPDGKNCSIFIEDNGTADETGAFITKPTIITDSDTLAWLETADLQGRISEADGQKTIRIVWNESNTEPVPPREVIRPDESLSYPNEIFTFSIDIGKTTSVTGDTGKASMIHFRGSSDCANFKGTIVSDCVDTRLKYDDEIETLSARYILSGTDAGGKPCHIYVENNGIDDNGMVTTPIIITDNPDLAWVESARLHGTVSWSPKLTIHVAAADND